MINFLAEVSIKDGESYIYPTPYHLNKKSNIYEIDISEPPESSFWLDWDGHYDNYVGTNIVLYYSEYLRTVDTIGELLITPLSMYIKRDLRDNLDCGNANNNSLIILDCSDANNNVIPINMNNAILEEIDIGDEPIFEFNTKVLINISRHPWLYPDYSISVRRVYPFLTYPLDPDNPSNLIIREEQGYPLLELPNFSVKLSDSINGVSLNQGFNINLINNDSFFDDEIRWNLFNSPISIKKSIKEKSEYKDFKEIRSGYVNDVITNFDSVQISVSDKLRSMNEPVCKIIKEEDFDFITTIDDKAVGKFIPIIYGTKNIPLIKLDNTHYLASEKIYQLLAVYDKDNNNITTYSNFDPDTMIITSTPNASNARIIGYTENKIGEIIKDLIIEKTRIPYGPTYWNTIEVDKYIQNSAQINIAITSGDVKKTIQEILKSDMAYLIQQQDGRLTIRKYGEKYKEHDLSSWMITQKPEKIYSSAMENYFSSCVINYLDSNNDNILSHFYNELENDAEFTYNKKITKVFETNLYNLNNVEALAELLSYRYTTMRQTIKVALGIDTSGMELLDTINLDLFINERKFSNANKFMIKEINPAQDILTLEEI